MKESEKEEDFQLIHIYIIDARKKEKKRTDSGWAAAGLLDARASICPAAGLFSLLLLLLHSVLLVYMNTSSEEEEEKRDYIYMYICYFIFQREYETPPRAEATRSNTDRSCCCCCCFCSKSLSSFYIFLKSCCFFFFFQFWFSSFSGAWGMQRCRILILSYLPTCITLQGTRILRLVLLLFLGRLLRLSSSSSSSSSHHLMF